MSTFADCSSQFLLNRLGRCVKLIVSSRGRGDRGELTQFSLKPMFCQNGTSLLNYVGMLVVHAISHVS